ncbi:MAG: VenA family class IV lanthipeptide [Egibacteraceae bacterium]
MTLEVDITALDRLPETDPIGSSYVELGNGCSGLLVTCLLLTCLVTSA